MILLAIVFVSEFQAQAKVKEVNSVTSLHQVLKTNLEYLDKDFSVFYTGTDVDIDTILTNAIPTVMKNSKNIKNNLKRYSYKGKYKTDGLLITYKISYYTSFSKEQSAKKEIDKQVEIIKKKYSNKLQQVKAVNDYIVKNTAYGDWNGDAAYTKYGVTHHKTAVCQGYTLVANYFFDQLNIPSKYVVGESRGRKHAWNKVKVNNSWYNIDTTWNDSKSGNSYAVSYKYFLISDKVLKKDHSWDESHYPAANSSEFDFLYDSSSMEIHKGKMYFSYDRDHQKMYVYNLQTGKSKKIANTRVQYLAYAKNNIYLSNYSDNGKLAVYNLKTGKIKNLNSRRSQFVHIKGEYIYFMSDNRYYKRKIKKH